MDEMIAAIYQITLDILNRLNEEKYEEIEEFLTKRNEMMLSVDEWKQLHPEQKYSDKAKRMIEETIRLDQKVTLLIKKEMHITEQSLNQLKNKKQVSMKYQPYSKQTNGVFVDKTK
ncbi:hypothetical protein V7111_26035 [Neobacillus niacini]|uniref:hypothetical protein n=1 Tax=Neobacillus niacini TaxID=86668 RepID=UPI0030037AFF